MSRAVILLLMCTLLAPVHAQEILEYRGSIEVTEKGFVSFDNPELRQTVVLTINNTHSQELAEFTYPFGDMINNLAVYDSYGELSSSKSEKGDKTYVTFTFRQPIAPGEIKTITVHYTSPDRILKYSKGFLKGDTYYARTSHSILANVKKFELRVIIPEGYKVVEYSPEAEKGSDGRRIILSWSYSEPIPPAFREFRAMVNYEPYVGYYYLYYAILIVAILAVMVFVYRYLKEEGISLQDYFDRQKYLEQKIDILKEDEQAIMKLIIEKDGIDQREIQDITGFSKTKVSKILAELEKRGAIRKEQYGRKNKVYLTKKVKET